MARVKMYDFVGERVDDRLKEMGWNRARLADSLQMTPQYLSRIYSSKRISERNIELMGKILNLAPEWIDGGIPDELLPHQYAIHLYQLNTVTPQQLVNTVLVTIGLDPEKVAREDLTKYWTVYNVIINAASDFMRG